MTHVETYLLNNRESLIELFVDKIKSEDLYQYDGCWNWKLVPSSKTGYGHFSFKTRQADAHRAAWIVFNGVIPDNLFVLHKCDNRICVNPNHLFLGTQKTNIEDKVNKLRQAKGLNHGLAFLSDQQVLLIRQQYPNIKSYSKLAEMFDCSETTIRDIVNNKTRVLQKP